MKPEYVTTDLELRSRGNISSLKDALSRDLFMLYHGREGAHYLTTFELIITRDINADQLANRFCNVIEKLQRQHKMAWDKCLSRHLDLGFHSGRGRKIGTALLKAETVSRLARLRIAVAISVYPIIEKQ